MAAFVLIGAGTDETISSSARCKVESVKVEPEVVVTNGEPDAGYKVLVEVSNSGEEGAVKVTARLSSSEGEWTKVRHVTMDAGSRDTLAFLFPEPTINATDIRAHGTCSP